MPASIVAILLFCSAQLCQAQGFRTRYYPPGAVNSYAKFIYETSPGNYIAGGLIVDLENGSQVSKLGIVGLDQDGKVTWLKKYGDGTYQYLFNQFVRRSFYRQGNFIYHACNLLDKSRNTSVGALIKLDLNGDTIWQRIYRDPDPLEDVVPQMVTESVDGGFLITGFFQNWSASPYSKCLLIKTDAHGNELWRKKIANISTNVQDGRAIVQDSASKKIVIVGYQYLNGPNSYDNVIVTDSLGVVKSQLGYNSVGGLLADLIQTKDKNMVGVGTKLYPETMGGNHLNKGFAVKFDLNALSPALWRIDNFGPLTLMNTFNCIYELEDGDMMIGGDLDTLQIRNITINTFHRLTRVDKDGIIKWHRIYDYRTDTSSFHQQSVTSIYPGSRGSILASFQVYNPGINPFFFVKYDSTGCDSTLVYCANMVGLEKRQETRSMLRVYPNPAKDQLQVEWDGSGAAELSLSDISGRVLKRMSLQSGEKVDLRDLNSGVYLVSLSRDKKLLYTTKLIKVD